MTVSTAYTPLEYAGNDATTAFAVTWPFFDNTLVVTLIASTGVETVKTITTHYTVSGGTDSDGLPATGTVTMLTAPASGETLRITRSTARTQAATWAENDAFPQKTVEAALDKAVLLIQESYDRGTTYDGINGDVLSFNSTGATDYWDAESQIIRNVATPTADSDAVTKEYVDDRITDLDDAALSIGTVTTGAAGTSASAELTGTYPTYTLNLTIPRGDAGAAGAGSGDVVGPAGATDNAIVRYNGATGTSIQDSAMTVEDTTGSLIPTADNTSVLGSATKTFADLFLGSGSVINWNNGDGTLTHSANTLTLAGITSLAMGTSIAVELGTIELGHATANTLSASSGELSIEGTVLKKVGKETIFIPAQAMVSRTTNGAAAGTTELATNDVMLATKDFDTTTEEGVGFFIAMPKSWNESTVTFKPFWTAASGSGGVVWGLAAYAFSNDDAMDTAVSGQQTSTDTLLTANDMHIGPESSAITIGGSPAEGDVVYFEITREVGDGSDTLGVDAKLIGIHLYITSNASTDA